MMIEEKYENTKSERAVQFFLYHKPVLNCGYQIN